MSDPKEPTTEIIVDWPSIREIYLSTEDDLKSVASFNGITVTDILIRARMEGWGTRGSRVEQIAARKSASADLSIEVVTSDHKVELFETRNYAASLIEEVMTSNMDVADKLKSLDKIASIQHKLVPIERKVHNIDSEMEELPARVYIVRNGKELERNVENDKA